MIPRGLRFDSSALVAVFSFTVEGHPLIAWYSFVFQAVLHSKQRLIFSLNGFSLSILASDSSTGSEHRLPLAELRTTPPHFQNAPLIERIREERERGLRGSPSISKSLHRRTDSHVSSFLRIWDEILLKPTFYPAYAELSVQGAPSRTSNKHHRLSYPYLLINLSCSKALSRPVSLRSSTRLFWSPLSAPSMLSCA